MKTIHVLNYLHDPKRRDRIQLQLNRGEARLLLAKKIRFADEGVFRSGALDEIRSAGLARGAGPRVPFQRARLLVSGRYNFEKITAPE